ncbi:TLD-domain-containing protein [Neocallimastix lanati (nom. inval.)]|jgi:hypothetical protein|uniref:Oxidation resistance protein 1 n=1 Tax=Neocallimastix californiae TaxID=1754190 RepID=A0A1Y2EUG3_9FUNG|nr:TLD-domain-containing protein [Neocallimastix sp. JGI-2020a]ORY74924.1 TLD-domain-containing protein [Neocallimastix californiae]|eukprot:ORY74924.1 TLD-domain-containing protein [Neocallimastix californiae]
MLNSNSFEVMMSNLKNCSTKKEKKSKKIRKFFSALFKKKHHSKSEIIENDNLSDISNCTDINAQEECYIKSSNKPFDTKSEATLYSLSNSSALSSTNDIYYNKINNPSNSSSYSSTNKNSINSNLTYISRSSFYSAPSVNSTILILSGNQIPLKLQGRYETTIPILNNVMAEQIRTRIPSLYKEAIHWKLLYSIDQHGLSLKTLYSNIKHAGPCVMAITTENDEVFGAFTSEPFDPSISNRYYGSGLSFIWKLNEHGNIDFFQAINSNQYYMLADNHFIAMGGGNGKFGFYLNENLIDGYISPCMTFDYNSNITENEKFECYGLEIWGFEF